MRSARSTSVKNVCVFGDERGGALVLQRLTQNRRAQFDQIVVSAVRRRAGIRRRSSTRAHSAGLRLPCSERRDRRSRREAEDGDRRSPPPR